jgi:hypothetical protein
VLGDLKDGASEDERVGVAGFFTRKIPVTKSPPVHKIAFCVGRFEKKFLFFF